MGYAPHMGSGGLTNAKLELANAGTGDVLGGKKFYAGDKELKTGTLALSGNAGTAQVLSGCTFYSNNPKQKLTGTAKIKVTTKSIKFANESSGWKGDKTSSVSFSELGLTEKPTVVLGFASSVGGGAEWHAREVSIKSYTVTNTSVTVTVTYSGDGYGGPTLNVSIITFG